MSKARDTSKTTAGPWRLRDGVSPEYRFQIYAGKDPIAYWSVRGYKYMSNAEKGVHIANARLMAQAPQLRDERDKLWAQLREQYARTERLESAVEAALGEIEAHGWNGADCVVDRLKKLMEEWG